MLRPDQMKWLALFLLVLQNTALVLLMRSSLTRPGDHYIVTTAVACMECVKVVTCLIVEGWGFKRLPDFLTHLLREVGKPRELLMLAVPSLLYTLQNNLLYIALANLDAAIYQVCYQLKILTTAVFSVVLLKRALSRTKWMSLVILTVGVSLAELDAHKASSASASAEDNEQSPALGFLCVLMACVTSGFAGVWFERVLKGVGGGAAATAKENPTLPTSSSSSSSSSSSLPSPPPRTSMWIRNIQMGVTSVIIALIAVYSKDRSLVHEKGFFYGYNSSVIGVILLQAMGGLVVAAVVKYADNILKGFGSSISIVISCTLEWAFFDFQPTLRFLLGASLVNLALYVYQDEGKGRSLLNGIGLGAWSGHTHTHGRGMLTATSTLDSPSGGAGLPYVHIPKSHPHETKGWFASPGGSTRKNAASSSSSASSSISGGASLSSSSTTHTHTQEAGYIPLKTFDGPTATHHHTHTTPAGNTAEWRASVGNSRAREVAMKSIV